MAAAGLAHASAPLLRDDDQAACAALREGPVEVCHPAASASAGASSAACVPLHLLLLFRCRLVRVLLREDLPVIAPRAEWPLLKEAARAEASAQAQAASSGGARGEQSLGAGGGCPGSRSREHLHLALALACAGLLESEAMAVPNAVAASISPLANASAGLLSSLLRCPWSTLAVTGWPFFALLARAARKIATAMDPFGDSSCPANPQWQSQMVAQAVVMGLQVPPLPPDALVVPQFGGGDDRDEAGPGSAAAEANAAACFWDAADALSLPQGPVCVSVPTAEEVLPPSALSARDCNAAWPSCSAAAARGLHYWMQLPNYRDMAADSIREEQRPFCVNNQGGSLVHAALGAILARRSAKVQRPLSLVEVGANYGDCTLSVHAAALQEGWPLNATVFEANPETLPLLEANIRLNGAEVRVRAAAVVDQSAGSTVSLLAHRSSAHAFVRDEELGQEMKARVEMLAGELRPLYKVETTTLDKELTCHDPVDLLLISVNGAELRVLEGARASLERRCLAKVIIAMTWHWEAYRQLLESYGYRFERQIRFDGTMWSLARAEEL
ncbi:unnamed protein product [Polarella glacialis]|uniref:Methyltransferase FkbM domain-containing protein n=2 Tax=Polarella glacialis TaxID=89957 RepID=A0A813HHG9_POLGL|nr:unnamed protein product [Polarella glacialis]